MNKLQARERYGHVLAAVPARLQPNVPCDVPAPTGESGGVQALLTPGRVQTTKFGRSSRGARKTDHLHADTTCFVELLPSSYPLLGFFFSTIRLIVLLPSFTLS